LSTKGQGRSGAEDEAIAQAGTQMALPIAQATQEQAAARRQQIFLQQAAARLQAQQLTARSQSEYNAIAADLDKVNAQMATNAAIAGGQLQGDAMRNYTALAGKGIDLGSHLSDQAAAWQLNSPAAILSLYGGGMDLAQTPQTLAQKGLTNQQQFMLGLLGQTPAPPGSMTTQTGTTSQNQIGTTSGTTTGQSNVRQTGSGGGNPVGSIAQAGLLGLLAAPELFKAGSNVYDWAKGLFKSSPNQPFPTYSPGESPESPYLDDSSLFSLNTEPFTYPTGVEY